MGLCSVLGVPGVPQKRKKSFPLLSQAGVPGYTLSQPLCIQVVLELPLLPSGQATGRVRGKKKKKER